MEDATAWYGSAEYAAYAEARALTPIAFTGRVLMFVEGSKNPG
jgi:hypothetical protein